MIHHRNVCSINNHFLTTVNFSFISFLDSSMSNEKEKDGTSVLGKMSIAGVDEVSSLSLNEAGRRMLAQVKEKCPHEEKLPYLPLIKNLDDDLFNLLEGKPLTVNKQKTKLSMTLSVMAFHKELLLLLSKEVSLVDLFKKTFGFVVARVWQFLLNLVNNHFFIQAYLHEENIQNLALKADNNPICNINSMAIAVTLAYSIGVAHVDSLDDVAHLDLIHVYGDYATESVISGRYHQIVKKYALFIHLANNCEIKSQIFRSTEEGGVLICHGKSRPKEGEGFIKEGDEIRKEHAQVLGDWYSNLNTQQKSEIVGSNSNFFKQKADLLNPHPITSTTMSYQTIGCGCVPSFFDEDLQCFLPDENEIAKKFSSFFRILCEIYDNPTNKQIAERLSLFISFTDKDELTEPSFVEGIPISVVHNWAKKGKNELMIAFLKCYNIMVSIL